MEEFSGNYFDEWDEGDEGLEESFEDPQGPKNPFISPEESSFLLFKNLLRKDPYQWQLKWLEGAERAKINLAMVPPGSGKTQLAIVRAIAESFPASRKGDDLIFRNSRGRYSLFAVPLRALASDIFLKIKEILEKLGIKNASKKIKLIEGPGSSYVLKSAKIIIATYEHAAILLNNKDFRDDIVFTVIDEIHELFGDRGPVVDRILMKIARMIRKEEKERKKKLLFWGFSGTLSTSEINAIIHSYNAMDIYVQKEPDPKLLRKSIWLNCDPDSQKRPFVWRSFVLKSVFSSLCNSLMKETPFPKIILFWPTVKETWGFLLALAIKHAQAFQSKGSSFQAIEMNLLINEMIGREKKKKEECYHQIEELIEETAILFSNDEDVMNRRRMQRIGERVLNSLIFLEEKGFFFHNAQAGQEYKTDIEGKARSGDFNLISATSTLAVGVDVKDADIVFVPPDPYRTIRKKTAVQMAGRCGRSKEGLAIVCAEESYLKDEVIRGINLSFHEGIERILDSEEGIRLNNYEDFVRSLRDLEGLYKFADITSFYRYLDTLGFKSPAMLSILKGVMEIYPAIWIVDFLGKYFADEDMSSSISPLLFIVFSIINPFDMNNIAEMFFTPKVVSKPLYKMAFAFKKMNEEDTLPWENVYSLKDGPLMKQALRSGRNKEEVLASFYQAYLKQTLSLSMIGRIPNSKIKKIMGILHEIKNLIPVKLKDMNLIDRLHGELDEACALMGEIVMFFKMIRKRKEKINIDEFLIKNEDDQIEDLEKNIEEIIRLIRSIDDLFYFVHSNYRKKRNIGVSLGGMYDPVLYFERIWEIISK